MRVLRLVLLLITVSNVHGGRGTIGATRKEMLVVLKGVNDIIRTKRVFFYLEDFARVGESLREVFSFKLF